MNRMKTWVAPGVAVVAMIVVIAVGVANWSSIGDSGIDLNGWIALILGVLATSAVGIGLMG